jgi:pyridoxine/pyridoxamine 5'-phosphate oxidase
MIDTYKIYNFMNEHSLMVISSVGPSGQPQSAVVGFGQANDLSIVFGTGKSNRKSKNITNDSRVSLVVGWDEGGTLQYEGNARLLNADEADELAEIYFKKNPSARRHKDSPDECYFLVKPTWIRYTDVSTDPWTVQESEF